METASTEDEDDAPAARPPLAPLSTAPARNDLSGGTASTEDETEAQTEDDEPAQPEPPIPAAVPSAQLFPHEEEEPPPLIILDPTPEQQDPLVPMSIPQTQPAAPATGEQSFQPPVQLPPLPSLSAQSDAASSSSGVPAAAHSAAPVQLPAAVAPPLQQQRPPQPPGRPPAGPPPAGPPSWYRQGSRVGPPPPPPPGPPPPGRPPPPQRPGAPQPPQPQPPQPPQPHQHPPSQPSQALSPPTTQEAARPMPPAQPQQQSPVDTDPLLPASQGDIRPPETPRVHVVIAFATFATHEPWPAVATAHSVLSEAAYGGGRSELAHAMAAHAGCFDGHGGGSCACGRFHLGARTVAGDNVGSRFGHGSRHSSPERPWYFVRTAPHRRRPTHRRHPPSEPLRRGFSTSSRANGARAVRS